MALNKESTGLILLGASEFLRAGFKFDKEEAFFEAKNRIKEYFTSSKGLGLNDSQILNLFDSESSADEIDEEIDNFIQRQKAESLEDLFVYYVGHGGFETSSQEYFLAIRATRARNLGVSSIRMQTLATTLKKNSTNLRIFIILDCCFSAEANKSFMSDISDAVAESLKNKLPNKGIGLLCSSSKDLPSLVIKDRKITMFSEGLEKALWKGDSSANKKYLTLREISSLTYSYIKQLNLDGDIRPEVFAPIQPVGDVTEIDHFFNYSYTESKVDIIAKKRIIQVDIYKNNLAQLSAHFIDFIWDFDEGEKYLEESLIVASQCSDLADRMALLTNNLDKDGNYEKLENLRIRREELYRAIVDIVRRIINK